MVRVRTNCLVGSCNILIGTVPSLISSFSLSITFGMIPRSEVKLHVQCGSEGSEKVGNKFHAVIGSDVAWDTILGKDVENEELCKLLRHDGIMSWNEE